MLDFYCFGLARSGLTAFARTLNLHPSIYCGVERFYVSIHPKDITFPASFLDNRFRGHPGGINHARKFIHRKEQQGVAFPTITGDKCSRKFFIPSHIGATKSICILRPHSQVAQSWEARANNSNDAWSPHRTGLMSFLDLLLFVQVVSEKQDTVIVDYNKLFGGPWHEELSFVFKALGTTMSSFDTETFEKRTYNTRPQRKGFYPDNRCADFAKTIGLNSFEDIFFNTSPLNRQQVFLEYVTYIRKNISVILNYFLDLLTVNEYQGLIDFFNMVRIGMNCLEIESYLPFRSVVQGRSGHSINTEKDFYCTLSSILKKPSAIYQKISYLCHNDGDLEKAIYYIALALKQESKSAYMFSRLGDLLIEKNDFKRAEKAFKRSVSLDNSLPRSFARLSRICDRLGDLERSLFYMGRAVEMDPQQANYHYNYGLLLRKNGDLEKSKQSLEKSLALSPNNKSFNMLLNCVLKELEELGPGNAAELIGGK